MVELYFDGNISKMNKQNETWMHYFIIYIILTFLNFMTKIKQLINFYNGLKEFYDVNRGNRVCKPYFLLIQSTHLVSVFIMIRHQKKSTII